MTSEYYPKDRLAMTLGALKPTDRPRFWCIAQEVDIEDYCDPEESKSLKERDICSKVLELSVLDTAVVVVTIGGVGMDEWAEKSYILNRYANYILPGSSWNTWRDESEKEWGSLVDRIEMAYGYHQEGLLLLPVKDFEALPSERKSEDFHWKSYVRATKEAYPQWSIRDCVEDVLSKTVEEVFNDFFESENGCPRVWDPTP